MVTLKHRGQLVYPAARINSHQTNKKSRLILSIKTFYSRIRDSFPPSRAPVTHDLSSHTHTHTHMWVCGLKSTAIDPAIALKPTTAGLKDCSETQSADPTSAHRSICWNLSHLLFFVILVPTVAGGHHKNRCLCFCNVESSVWRWTWSSVIMEKAKPFFSSKEHRLLKYFILELWQQITSNIIN